MANRSSLGRLIATNLLSLAALAITFAIILGTVSSLRQLFQTEVNHNVAMAAKSFMLGRSFLTLDSEAQAIHSTYLHAPEDVITRSKTILSHLDNLIMEASTSDNFLRQDQGINIFHNYRSALGQFLDDEITISKNIMDIDSYNRLFLQKLATIEDHLGQLIMKQVLTGDQATGLLQITALIPFCREQILHAQILVDQAAHDHDTTKLIYHDQTTIPSTSLTSAITNLRQTLSTITSADPAISDETETIIAMISPYLQTVKQLTNSINSANYLSKEAARTRNDILHFLNEVDQKILVSLKKAEQRSNELLSRTTHTIYTITALILIVSLVGASLVHIIGRQLSASAKSAETARNALHTRVVRLKEEIAGRKQAESELHTFNESLEVIVQHRTQELTDTTNELETLIAAMSHDLRTPLQGIAGFSHALREKYGDRLDTQGRAYLNQIQEFCLRAGDTIDTILDLSRLSRCALTVSTINLSDIVQSVLTELKHNNPERQVATVIAPTPSIQADPRLMRALLEPLVNNAWKFTSHIDKAIIQFGSREQEGERVFFIKDNGAGFNMVYANKLFTLFQRLHSPDQFPGNGIGLAIAQRIINRYQGKIWSHGRENVGASFFFTLPDTEQLPCT
ncbi:MAG: hypothetical protein KKD63_00565 [Proteobacteria bacterium]|nr:hypothetical protein [Desulfobulbaceae bacterium]MBU4151350.1 hypothetical protein [Pseudomonadota bacterium]